MNGSKVFGFRNPAAGMEDPLTALLRAGAEHMLCQAVVSRLKTQWQAEYAAWCQRSPAQVITGVRFKDGIEEIEDSLENSRSAA